MCILSIRIYMVTVGLQVHKNFRSEPEFLGMSIEWLLDDALVSILLH